MADLRTCYFCGTGPGGSLDSYGVVPPALDPAPDEQRSVVLCPDCRNKLTALLRPVVDAAESSPAAGTGSSGLSPADDEVTDLGESSSGTGDPGQSPPDGNDQTDAGDAADGPEVEHSPGEQADVGVPTSERDEPGAAGEPAGNEQGATGGSADPADRSVSFDDSGDSSESGGGLAASSSGGDTPSKPRDPSAEALMGDDSEAYRKVIRLLQNRDFPVRRDEIEELAASAYELGPGECSDAIDAIIQKGLLVEEEGTLRRTGD